MPKNEKARTMPGKDDASPIVMECAACGAPIRKGEQCGSVLVPVGVTFEGALIGEKLPVCAACIQAAEQSDAAADEVSRAVRARYDAQGAAAASARIEKGTLH